MKVMHGDETSQLETTRAERFLALAMIVFLLIGGAWVFREIQTLPPRPDWVAIEERHLSQELKEEYRTTEATFYEAQNNLSMRQDAVNKASLEYEFRREEYRVALDKGIEDPEREAVYLDALKRFEDAQLEVEVATTLAVRSQARMDELRHTWNSAQEKIQLDYAQAQRQFEWKLFLLRILFAIPVFMLSLLTFAHLRKRNSNYLVFGTALIGFASLQLAYLFALYAWHLLRDVAQIVVSVTGTALCIVGIVWIRRYVLDSERVARARVRKGQCPSCGTGAGDQMYCISCGEALQKKCQSCGNNRPVHSEFCPQCGEK